MSLKPERPNKSVHIGSTFHQTMHESDIILSIKGSKFKIIKDKYSNFRKDVMSKDEIVTLCVQLLSKKYFNYNLNVFRDVFERDLEKAIQKVLRFHIYENF
jgi:hypothetical protein